MRGSREGDSSEPGACVNGSRIPVVSSVRGRPTTSFRITRGVARSSERDGAPMTTSWVSGRWSPRDASCGGVVHVGPHVGGGEGWRGGSGGAGAACRLRPTQGPGEEVERWGPPPLRCVPSRERGNSGSTRSKRDGTCSSPKNGGDPRIPRAATAGHYLIASDAGQLLGQTFRSFSAGSAASADYSASWRGLNREKSWLYGPKAWRPSTQRPGSDPIGVRTEAKGSSWSSSAGSASIVSLPSARP